MRSAVAMARAYPAAKLEASGGLRLENAREVASTGVHYLSVGALTHSSPALDLALDVGLSADAVVLHPRSLAEGDSGPRARAARRVTRCCYWAPVRPPAWWRAVRAMAPGSPKAAAGSACGARPCPRQLRIL
jgi:hypothetical protein